jgi:hypothetical protein
MLLLEGVTLFLILDLFLVPLPEKSSFGILKNGFQTFRRRFASL